MQKTQMRAEKAYIQLHNRESNWFLTNPKFKMPLVKENCFYVSSCKKDLKLQSEKSWHLNLTFSEALVLHAQYMECFCPSIEALFPSSPHQL